MAADGPDAQADGTGKGLVALLAVRPRWTGLEIARRLVTVDGRWLLHAGPPLEDPCDPPKPLLSSAVLACLYEGWAQTPEHAEALIRRGVIRLLPAHAHGAVTPLAALITPSTTMIVVEGAGRAAHAPLGTFHGPDLRFGSRDAAILERLRNRDVVHARILRVALGEPIELLPIAHEAVSRGDDLHNRTSVATELLGARLTARYANAAREWQRRFEAVRAGIAATPLFFLTFWMAAAKLMLMAAEGGAPGTLVTRMAGNGEAFGISLAANPQQWITTPAGAPVGAYLNASLDGTQALGAIGDSAIIDALGFGGQALHLAPEPYAALMAYLPADAGMGAAPLMLGSHPAFADLDVKVGVDAARVVESRRPPVVTLGMIDARGERGLLGRGVYVPPIELFRNAIEQASSRRDA